MTILRVALVTGASSGFGQATAALLAAQGFLVFGTSRTPAPSSSASYELLSLDQGVTFLDVLAPEERDRWN